LILLGAALSGSAENDGSFFDFNELRNRAQNLAMAPYQPPEERLPRALRTFDYDDMRNIRYDPKEAVWRRARLPFQLQFFHRGGSQIGRIRVNTVEDGLVVPVSFSKDLFDYSQSKNVGRLPDDFGFNGFRIHYPINSMEYLDEVVVFQGASYFRALAQGLHYGLSARGLAIDVAGANPEEFPEFVEFWIERPGRLSSSIKLYALLNSPGVAGAFEMVLTPGEETVMQVNATLFPRRTLDGIGLAPLTSMFWFGENSPSRFGDFRPEVHDSDGLLVHTGEDEWLWRPLSNDGRVKTSYFSDNHPRGFGLFQRDRNFESYQDLEALYQDRPGAWVVPGTNWGPGQICLVELPTGTEYADNIVAFWTPAKPLLPQTPFDYSYSLHWLTDNAACPPLARTVATRCGNLANIPGGRKFVLDFGAHEGLDRNNPDSVKPVISLINGTLKESRLQLNQPGNSWRVFFDVEPIDKTRPVEARCHLESGDLPRSETWTCFWNP
jgi:glucans biosynthesis protein